LNINTENITTTKVTIMAMIDSKRGRYSLCNPKMINETINGMNHIKKPNEHILIYLFGVNPTIYI
jgi:hypothetical protein